MIRLSAMGDWELVFYRAVLSGIVFSLVVMIECFKSKSLNRLMIGWDGFLLAAFTTIYFCTFVIGMILTKVANVLIILALAPMFSALFDLLFRKIHLAGRTWFAMFLCLIGVVVLVADGVGTGSHMGNIYALVTAIFVGAQFTMMGKVKYESVLPALALGFTFPALIAIPFVSTLTLPSESIAPVLIMGLIILPGSFLLISRGPQYLPAPEVALYMLVETVGGPFLVWLFLGENPGKFALIGGIIVISTLAWHSAVDLKQAKTMGGKGIQLKESDFCSGKKILHRFLIL
ncbi:MAG: DMT family transporter [Desulfobacterales bacterium]|nr:DMT family transporter [Desulfobacterales bacterium]